MNCPHCHTAIDPQEIPDEIIISERGRRNSRLRRTRGGGPKPKAPHPYSSKCRCGACKRVREAQPQEAEV
jgi:hypothetical protein